MQIKTERGLPDVQSPFFIPFILFFRSFFDGLYRYASTK